MANNTFIKDPDAVLDYTINWAAWLDSDTISDSSWTVPSGLTKSTEFISDTLVTLWLIGGTAGTTYNILNHITTAGGREEDQTLEIICKQK